MQNLQQNAPPVPQQQQQRQRKRPRHDSRPTRVHPYNSDKATLPKTTKYDRIRRTLKASATIHCATGDNVKPALDGLWLTFSKECKEDKMLEYFKKSRKFKFHVLPKLVNKKTEEFEKSETKIIQSVSTFYSNGLVSKEK